MWSRNLSFLWFHQVSLFQIFQCQMNFMLWNYIISNWNFLYNYLPSVEGNNHLIEFQLIKIVFYHLIKIMLITWPNFLTLFTWSNYSINCQKITCIFWQLIKSSNNGILGFLKFRSTAKIRQFFLISWSNNSIKWKVSKNSVKWLT